jgi:hypothetical protein
MTKHTKARPGSRTSAKPAVATPSSQRGLTNLWLIRGICHDVERLSSEDLSLREQVQFERRIRFWAKSICREGRPQRRQTRDALARENLGFLTSATPAGLMESTNVVPKA